MAETSETYYLLLLLFPSLLYHCGDKHKRFLTCFCFSFHSSLFLFRLILLYSRCCTSLPSGTILYFKFKLLHHFTLFLLFIRLFTFAETLFSFNLHRPVILVWSFPQEMWRKRSREKMVELLTLTFLTLLLWNPDLVLTKNSSNEGFIQLFIFTKNTSINFF